MSVLIPDPLTSERLTDALDVLPVQQHPFGRSLCGRPLTAVSVGYGRPVMLYVAGHHAMEWLPGWTLLDFAREYMRFFAENRAPRGTFWLVPLLNPDGVALAAGGYDPSHLLAPRQVKANGGSTDFSHWQANARGVDLNHNYPAGFDAYRSVEASLGIYGGAPTRYSGVAPLSEPETQALAALIDFLSPDVTVALHTQGEEVFCGITPEARTHLLAHLAARHLGYRLSRPTGAAAYGGLTDWLSERGMCALTLECGRGVNPLPPGDYLGMSHRLLPTLLSLPGMLQYVNNL